MDITDYIKPEVVTEDSVKLCKWAIYIFQNCVGPSKTEQCSFAGTVFPNRHAKWCWCWSSSYDEWVPYKRYILYMLVNRHSDRKIARLYSGYDDSVLWYLTYHWHICTCCSIARGYHFPPPVSEPVAHWGTVLGGTCHIHTCNTKSFGDIKHLSKLQAVKNTGNLNICRYASLFPCSPPSHT